MRSGRARRSRAARLPSVASAASALLALPLAACQRGVLDPRGPIAAADRQIMLDAFAIMLVIVVPTLVAALAFAWWYRDSNGRARRRPHFVYSGRVELLVWSVPLLTIMFLAGVTWIGSHRLDPARPIDSPAAPLEVQAVSLDWKWLFIYPGQHVAAVNRLVVPAGVPLHFSITSASVMNAFFVPQLGSMIAAMNGMVTQLYLQADAAGEYYGESTQFSGDGFSDMHFPVQAVSSQDFDRWVADTKRAGGVLDRGAYEALEQQTPGARAATYGAIDAGLFPAIVKQEIPPGPGPHHGHGGLFVNPRTGG